MSILSFLTLAHKRKSEFVRTEETEFYLHSGELGWYGQFCAFHTESMGKGNNKARQAGPLPRRPIWGVAVVTPTSSPTTNTKNSGRMCGKWRWSKKWKKASQESSKWKRETGEKSSSCGHWLTWMVGKIKSDTGCVQKNTQAPRPKIVFLISYQGTFIMEDKKLLEE